jgi:NAD-dependent SIR2 family protein deacetylase
MTVDAENFARAARAAADAVRAADALVIAAGAGMGVDSGLPDFRGTEGFWNAYPPYRASGLRFEELANPAAFRRDPAVGWGFYGHRLNLYRATEPHAGFGVLRRWAEAKPGGGFVFTSNVDGHFQRAGFDADRVLECHGSIRYLQCARPCGGGGSEDGGVWSAKGVAVTVDEATMRAAEPFPACPACGGLARPNILMFGDGEWVQDRTAEQQARFQRWVAGRNPRWLVVIEMGAGGAIPTVRRNSEWLQQRGATLVRINPRESQGPAGTISIPVGALAALRAIDALLLARRA